MVAPTQDQSGPIVELVNSAEIAEHGEPDFSPEDLFHEWDQLSLETDAWTVLDPEGRLVGYADVVQRGHGHLESFAVTHPVHRGRGIGSTLVGLIEERAAQRIDEAPPGARVSLGNFVSHANPEALGLLESRGYGPARSYWRMTIQLDEQEPQAAEWPPGLTVRSFVPGRDERPTFDATEEAFADHWGHVPTKFEVWVRRTRRESFDPAIWFLAIDGDQIAGVSLCSAESETPWVDTLAVRRPWRRRGLGLALLQHSFAELWRRGYRRIALGVDSQNIAGATRLYERAGMRVDRQWDLYERELRPGRELATQTLAAEPA